MDFDSVNHDRRKPNFKGRAWIHLEYSSWRTPYLKQHSFGNKKTANLCLKNLLNFKIAFQSYHSPSPNWFFYWGTESYTFTVPEAELLNMVFKNKLLLHFWCKHNHSVHPSLVWLISHGKALPKLPKNTYTTPHHQQDEKARQRLKTD